MNTVRRTRQQGFTLVEMLVSMVILGILMLAFTQVFGGSLKAAGEINGRNELVTEGQVAQQLIAARLQSAVYVYQKDTTMQLTTSGKTTKNTVGPSTGQNWKVGIDPILAVVLPPKAVVRDASENPLPCSSATRDACFTFYAYYPYRRGALISSGLAEVPPENSANDDQWVLMEYKKYLYDGVTRSSLSVTPPSSWSYTSILGSGSSINIRGESANILVDYLQPETSTPAYTMFSVSTMHALNNVTMNFRFLQMRGAKELRAPAATGSAPLSTRVYPRNWY